MTPDLIETFEAITEGGRRVTVNVWQEYREIPATAVSEKQVVPRQLKTVRTADGFDIAGGTTEGELWIPSTGEKLTRLPKSE